MYIIIIIIIIKLFATRCYCGTFGVALRIRVKPLRIREDLGPWTAQLSAREMSL